MDGSVVCTQDQVKENACVLRRDASVVLRLDLTVCDRCRTAGSAEEAGGCRRVELFFDQRVPLAAIGALTKPFSRLISAILADKNGIWLFRHAVKYLIDRAKSKVHKSYTNAY